MLYAANHWPLAVEAHAANHPETRHECQDLRQADWTSLPAHDLLLASPACQGHSTAANGARRSNGGVAATHDALRATAWAVVDWGPAAGRAVEASTRGTVSHSAHPRPPRNSARRADQDDHNKGPVGRRGRRQVPSADSARDGPRDGLPRRLRVASQRQQERLDQGPRQRRLPPRRPRSRASRDGGRTVINLPRLAPAPASARSPHAPGQRCRATARRRRTRPRPSARPAPRLAPSPRCGR